MLNDPAVKDSDAGEEQLSGVKAALDCIEDFVDNMDMVSFYIFRFGQKFPAQFQHFASKRRSKLLSALM